MITFKCQDADDKTSDNAPYSDLLCVRVHCVLDMIVNKTRISYFQFYIGKKYYKVNLHGEIKIQL